VIIRNYYKVLAQIAKHRNKNKQTKKQLQEEMKESKKFLAEMNKIKNAITSDPMLD
jgi:transcriptional regulator of heat shock response